MKFETYKSWVHGRVNLKNAKVCDVDPYATPLMLPYTQSFYSQLALAGSGLTGEAGEIGDTIKKVVFHGKVYTPEVHAKMLEEMGDTLWYFALLCELLGVTMDQLIEANIQKLMLRDGAAGENFAKARGAVS